MNSLVGSSLFRSVTLVGVLVFQIALPIEVRSAGDNPRGFVNLATLDGRDESHAGYLQVYSATDEFDDGGTSYYAHSSYLIYTSDGKLFKKIENHISPSDETPDLVVLPGGAYTVEARSETRGYIRMRVVVKPGNLTILDLESEQPLRFAQLVAKPE